MTLHQICVRASSCQVCLSFKFSFSKKKKKKKKGEKKRRKKKNPLVVNEDLRTNLFSQEEESDAKSRHDF